MNLVSSFYSIVTVVLPLYVRSFIILSTPINWEEISVKQAKKGLYSILKSIHQSLKVASTAEIRINMSNFAKNLSLELGSMIFLLFSNTNFSSYQKLIPP